MDDELTTATTASVSDPFAAWKQQTAELRRRLLEEESVLTVRLEDIRSQLAVIPDPDKPATPPAPVVPAVSAPPVPIAAPTPAVAPPVQRPTMPRPDPKTATVSALARWVVTQHAEGISAAQVVRETQAMKPTATSGAVYVALDRLPSDQFEATTSTAGIKTYRPRHAAK